MLGRQPGAIDIRATRLQIAAPHQRNRRQAVPQFLTQIQTKSREPFGEKSGMASHMLDQYSELSHLRLLDHFDRQPLRLLKLREQCSRRRPCWPGTAGQGSPAGATASLATPCPVPGSPSPCANFRGKPPLLQQHMRAAVGEFVAAHTCRRPRLKRARCRCLIVFAKPHEVETARHRNRTRSSGLVPAASRGLPPAHAYRPAPRSRRARPHRPRHPALRPRPAPPSPKRRLKA